MLKKAAEKITLASFLMAFVGWFGLAAGALMGNGDVAIISLLAALVSIANGLMFSCFE